MNTKIFLGVLVTLIFASCNQLSKETETLLEQEEPKFQYTVYSNEFELFAEADPFIVGETSNVLSHFTILPVFKPAETEKITAVLTVNGNEVRQTLDKPTRTGIYSYDLKPETQGKGSLKFEISNVNGSYEVVIPEVIVFASHDEAHTAAESAFVSRTNTTVFTKEQSWKIDFSTGFPKTEPFGQVIKATALVQSAQSNELVISAKINGIMLFNSGVLLEGQDVSVGQSIFTISASNFVDNNISVKFSEAQSNYEKANADYIRAKELVKDKIVSEKDLLEAKNQYENTKAIYDNLSKNFNTSGQTITSPQAGFIKQMFVKNGSYVEAGQPIVIVSQNKSLVLEAEVPSKYASDLANIKTANIRTITDNISFTLKQLNGKVLSYGKAANNDNYLIPIVLQIENNGSFVPGSFVELYLKSFSNNLALVIPTMSLLEEQGSYFIWVQVTPELFEKREVFVGGTDGINTEIKKGIIVSERIVTSGAMLIKLAQATGTLDAESGHVH